jgi:small multidrug resistance family-3 protein
VGALRTVGIFVVAALAELGGTYAVWRWLREGSTPLLALAGVAALFGYAVVQTYQPADHYGRVYAAYAGVFLVGATLWGWLVDGKTPDRFDAIGAGIVLLGIVTIVWGRGVFA